MASPDGVVQQGFGDGRGVMGSHRVASMAGLPKATWSSSLKMDHKLMEVTASELSGVHRDLLHWVSTPVFSLRFEKNNASLVL
jgi:hypothetical protein